MSTTLRKLLGYIYNDMPNNLHDKFVTIANILMDPSVQVKFSFEPYGTRAYTTIEGEVNHLRVVVGGKLVKEITEAPDSFPDKETFRPYYEPIIKSMYGLHLHELGHDRHTDMSDKRIIDYPKPEYRNSLHNFFNSLEDIVIEAGIDYTFHKTFPDLVRPQKYFDYITSKLFEPKCEKYEDDGSSSSFFNYLLLVLRCGLSKIKNKCKAWNDHEDDIIPLIKAVLMERNPTERITKTIILAEWCFENIPEIDWALSSLPPDGPISGSKPLGPKPKTIEIDCPSPGSIFSDCPESGDEKEDEMEDESEDIPEPSLEENIDDMDIDDAFNDLFTDFHETVIVKDEYTYSSDLEAIIDEKIQESNDMIMELSKAFDLFYSRIAPRRTVGFTRGHLNLRAAIQDDINGGTNFKVFEQDIKRGQAPDLAISLVCDNSGSMTGTKSHITSKATLALAQACEFAKIPFECSAFTKTNDTTTGICITLKIKSFEDELKRVKPYFAINDSSLIHKLKSTISVPTFCGNSEEVNLFHIGNAFKKVDHKTKLMIVLCDGETTGSRKDLKKVVEDMEQQGIIVIGLGICDKGVEGIYSKTKIFPDISSLNELAGYLINTLNEYAK